MIQVTPFLPPMGSDDTVVDAARVSFSKTADVYTPEQNRGLIQYLAKHGHWSPFAHPHASFRISAPVFVARQLSKHVVGLAWNEESRRYITHGPQFYRCDWRSKPTGSIKQGSGEPIAVEDSQYADHLWTRAVSACRTAYVQMLEAGIAPEQARSVLPMCTIVSWVWTGSLYAFARVVLLRTGANAQAETKQVALAIDQHMKQWYPVSWDALLEHVRVAD